MNSPSAQVQQARELLPCYLARLNISPAEPDRVLLERVMSGHLAQLPFASVSVRLGEPMPLALPELLDRLVTRSRGGYCFEQNALLQAMLGALGFETRLLLARVIYDQDIHPGLTHRMMLVMLAGEAHVVDVGFGALGPRRPVPMSGEEIVDGWRRFRVAESRGGEFRLQCLKDGRWFTLYRFELHRYGESDCELGHFYSHRHPAATFVNHLVAARLMPDRILSLRGDAFAIQTADGESEARVADAQSLHRVLTTEFALALSMDEAMALHSRLAVA